MSCTPKLLVNIVELGAGRCGRIEFYDVTPLAKSVECHKTNCRNQLCCLKSWVNLELAGIGPFRHVTSKWGSLKEDQRLLGGNLVLMLPPKLKQLKQLLTKCRMPDKHFHGKF